jgi:peroxiredoxin
MVAVCVLSLCLIAGAEDKPPKVPPVLSSVGQPTVVFTGDSLDGKAIRFPADYRGKIVLLDFWSYGCPQCKRLIPGLVTAYADHRKRGFEVLGVCVDGAGEKEAIQAACLDLKMTWPQIAAGWAVEGDVALLYGVESVPNALLIDGTTGKVLATAEDLRRDGVENTVRKVLAIRDVLREAMDEDK